MARHNHPAEVTALAVVVRSVVDELGTRGKRVAAGTTAALQLVERWLAGGAVSVEALGAAAASAHQDGVPLAQREQDRALSWANTAVGNLAFTATKARGWKDGERTILDAASYALSSLRVDGVRDREALDALRREALARAGGSGARLPRSPRSAAPRPKPVGAALAPFLGVVAAARLAKLAPVFDPARRGSAASTRALLEQRRYPVHPAVLDFEARYGGLVVADHPGAEGRDWLCGAFACLSTGGHETAGEAADERELVPVVYSPNDVIYFLDGRGVAWAEDTIEGPAPAPFAADGDVLVTRIMLYQIVFERGGVGGAVELPGRLGEAAAAALELPLIAEGSDELARFWGDRKALVVEDQLTEPGQWQTRVTGDGKRRIAAVAAGLVTVEP